MNDEYKPFSEEHGYTQPKPLQREAMDEDLRTGLWNAFYESFPFTVMGGFAHSHSIYEHIHRYFSKKSLTKYCKNHVKENNESVEQIFLSGEWYRVLDLVKYVIWTRDNKSFVDQCNAVFEQENFAYRIIAGRFVAEITSEQEIEEIQTALKIPYASAKGHLEKALTLFSDRENPDYENSAKESISAVESVAKEITGEHNGTLGQLASKLDLHPAFEKGLKQIYGFTSDAHGIRHSESDEPLPLDETTARFMLVTCSAFVNYIIARNPKIQPD